MSRIKKNYGKGTLELNFGINAFNDLTDMHGTDLDGMDEILNKPGGMRDLIYCAAKMANRKKDFKLDKFDIGDWLDEMSQEDFDDIIKAFNKTKIYGRELEGGASK